MARVTERDGTRAIARAAFAGAIGFGIGGALFPLGRGLPWGFGFAAIAASGSLGGAAISLAVGVRRAAVPLALAGAAGTFTGFFLAFPVFFSVYYDVGWWLLAGAVQGAVVGTWLGVAMGDLRAILRMAAVGAAAFGPVLALGAAAPFRVFDEPGLPLFPWSGFFAYALLGAALGAAAAAGRGGEGQPTTRLRIAAVLCAATPWAWASLSRSLAAAAPFRFEAFLGAFAGGPRFALAFVGPFALGAAVFGGALGFAGRSWRWGLLATLPLTFLAALSLGLLVALVEFGALIPEDLPPDVLGGGMRLALLPLAGSLGGAAGAWFRRR